MVEEGNEWVGGPLWANRPSFRLRKDLVHCPVLLQALRILGLVSTHKDLLYAVLVLIRYL